MIYILTGEGKGKTTSAIGMGVRAAGAGKKILMISFLKTGNLCSENKIIRKIKEFDLKTFGQKGFFVPKNYLKTHPKLKKIGVKPAAENDLALIRKGFNLAKMAATSKKYDILILDEICIVLKFGFISKKIFLDFLKKYGQKLDIVLTGRNCPKEITEIADLVTNFEEIKHYYQRGVKARRGIEF